MPHTRSFDASVPKNLPSGLTEDTSIIDFWIWGGASGVLPCFTGESRLYWGRLRYPLIVDKKYSRFLLLPFFLEDFLYGFASFRNYQNRKTKAVAKKCRYFYNTSFPRKIF